MTRNEAAAAGHKRYATGRACSKGHIGERYTTTGNCIACAKVSRGMFSTASIAQANGMVEVKFLVHRTDERVIRDFVDALAAAHQFDIPAGPTMLELAIAERAT